MDPDAPLDENARRIVAVRVAELRSFAPKALHPSEVETLHDMRIAAKRLRYVLEITSPAFGPGAEQGVNTAKDLQDLLGEIHDCDVMLPRVRAHVKQLRAEDTEHLRMAAGGAEDLSPKAARAAPNRLRYRGLEALHAYLSARRAVLFDRFVSGWEALEERGFAAELDEALSERAQPGRPGEERSPIREERSPIVDRASTAPSHRASTERDSQFEEDAEALVAHPFHSAIEALEAYEYPVIAALNGHAIGGGLELALTCDVRIAAREIKVGMPPAKLGLIYSHTGLRRFLELCGPAHTAELFYVGKSLDAERGCEIGLIQHVTEGAELEGRTLAMAAEIAANAPLSLSGNKRIMRTLRAHEGGLPEDVEREMVDLRESCFRSEDFREGVTAFREKRSPHWQGR